MNFIYPKSSWVEISADSDFSIYNLPYGVFRYKNKSPRVGVAIGDYVLDLAALHRRGYLDSLFLHPRVFRRKSLNAFIRLGQPYWIKLRSRLLELLDAENPELQDAPKDRRRCLIPINEVSMHLPVAIGDYTDFYSSLEHATNVGKMFRPDQAALLPNWKHMPVGYHGRSGSIIPSGQPIHRPCGQLRPDDNAPPVYGPSRLLDFELEMGFIIGKSTELGETVSVDDAMNHIFGMVIVNDWSARDIQKWEYVPLGPFLGKNFGTSISPWVVPTLALMPFQCEAPEQDVQVLPYLTESNRQTFDIELFVDITPEHGETAEVVHSNFRYLYWTMAQQLAHQTVNGCNIQIGDLYASGTISGPVPESFGSMLERSWRGEKPVDIGGGETRKFIQDGDTVTMRAVCRNKEIRVGFGSVSTLVLPALK
jgi:fumarylacetoacetase